LPLPASSRRAVLEVGWLDRISRCRQSTRDDDLARGSLGLRGVIDRIHRAGDDRKLIISLPPFGIAGGRNTGLAAASWRSARESGLASDFSSLAICETALHKTDSCIGGRRRRWQPFHRTQLVSQRRDLDC